MEIAVGLAVARFQLIGLLLLIDGCFVVADSHLPGEGGRALHRGEGSVGPDALQIRAAVRGAGYRRNRALTGNGRDYHQGEKRCEEAIAHLAPAFRSVSIDGILRMIVRSSCIGGREVSCGLDGKKVSDKCRYRRFSNGSATVRLRMR